jgi:uncharacterized RDD family membrane protein YckC
MTVQAPIRYAGLVTRLVAFLIDAAIVSLIALVVTGSVSLVLSIFGSSIGDLPEWVKVVFGVGGWIVLNVVYFVGSWTLTGQTAGMRAMSIRVAGKSGERLSIWRGAVRLAGLILAAIPLFAGYLLILLNDRRRGLQDLLAGSVVVFSYDREAGWGGPLQRQMARERKRLSAGDAPRDAPARPLLPGAPSD